MLTAPDLALDATIFNNNLTALRDAGLTAAADQLQAVTLPADARIVQSRDGRPTIVWTDAAGNACWLGATKMPAIRSDGLLDRFDAGNGNVALIGMGQGHLLDALLRRLSPTQAVIVVSRCVPDAALVLHLYDFADAIRAGRLLLFVGDRAWEDLPAHLREHDGYLAPERLLNWPWFTPADVAHATERLSQLSAAMARHRAESLQALARCDSPSPTADSSPGVDAANATRRRIRLAIYCPQGDGVAAVRARSLARAAAQLDPEACAVLTDHPARRHSIVAAREVARVRPEWVVIVDAPRNALPATAWPDAHVVVWITDSALVHEESVKRLGPHDRLVVPDEAGRQAALRLGIPPDRVRRIPPAGDPLADVIVAPPAANLDAAAVGLRFAAQKAVWEAARRIARGRVGVWRDESAEELLRAAMRETGVHFQSGEVRDGMLERIRCVLGPGVECNTYLEVWNESLRTHRGKPTAPGCAAGRPAIFMPGSGRLVAGLLDAAAAGCCLFVRQHPRQAEADGWASFLDPETHVSVFSSPAELKRLCESYVLDSQDFIEKARSASEHVALTETWRHRLTAALDA